MALFGVLPFVRTQPLQTPLLPAVAVLSYWWWCWRCGKRLRSGVPDAELGGNTTPVYYQRYYPGVGSVAIQQQRQQQQGHAGRLRHRAHTGFGETPHRVGAAVGASFFFAFFFACRVGRLDAERTDRNGVLLTAVRQWVKTLDVRGFFFVDF